MRLVLASASPRRAELLTSAGFSFDVAPADVDETPRGGEPPADYALRVARDKARVISATRGDAHPILAADTVVVAARRILGKPENDDEARQMLTVLSGSVHDVLTAVVFLHDGREVAEVASTRVRFAALTADEIDWYIRTGEPRGKAGAYAIQGLGARFVEWIEGSWSNVVGLPLAPVYRMLRQLGVVCSG
jgi:septum formation protein